MLLLILALSVHGETWPEGSVAGSLGLIRPIRVNGELTTISIPANYIEYYSLTAPVGQSISVALVPCSGRFDSWARIGTLAPVNRALTDTFFSYENMLALIKNGRFFSIRAPPSYNSSSSLVVAISAQYNVPIKLQMVMRYGPPRQALTELDRVYW